MMRGGTLRCTRKNSTKHDLSDTAVIEMDVLEDLDRSNSAPANIRYKNENVYMSNKTRR